MGRAWSPGEPLFLPEDRDKAIALAQEERATCPRCGLLKVWCRDPGHQFAFEPVDDVCWPTARLAEYQRSDAWKKKGPDGQAATLLAVRFRDGYAPSLTADLGLVAEEGDRPEDEPDHGGQQHHEGVVP